MNYNFVDGFVSSYLLSVKFLSQVLSEMLVRLLDNALIETVYPAELAGLSFTISTGDRGISFSCAGFDQKLGHLVGVVLRSLAEMKFEPTRFSMLREKYARGLANVCKSQAHELASQYSSEALRTRTWRVDDMQAALQDISFEDVITHRRALLSRGLITMLVFGNTSTEGALELTRKVRRFHS
jgi:insulysin